MELNKNINYGIINDTQSIILDIVYDYIEVGEVGDSYMYKIFIDSKCGCANEYGNIVIPIIYDIIYTIKDIGKFLVWLNGKYGILNTAGKKLTEIKYDNMTNVSPDYKYTVVRIGDYYGMLDEKYKEITDIKFDNISATDINGLFKVAYHKGKYGLIDSKGNEITGGKYDDININKNGQIIIRVLDKYGLLDINGTEITPIKYKYIYGFGKIHSDGFYYSIFNYDGKYGILRSDGKVHTEAKYDRIDFGGHNKYITQLIRNGETIQGVITITQKDLKESLNTTNNIKYGLLTGNGTISIKILYDYIEFADDEVFNIKLGNKVGRIYKNGEILIDPIYDYINKQDDDYIVRRNDKYGMLSENGSTKIPVKYDDFGYLKDGVNVYSVKLSGKYFYINDRNEIIKRPKY